MAKRSLVYRRVFERCIRPPAPRACVPPHPALPGRGSKQHANPVVRERRSVLDGEEAQRRAKDGATPREPNTTARDPPVGGGLESVPGPTVNGIFRAHGHWKGEYLGALSVREYNADRTCGAVFGTTVFGIDGRGDTESSRLHPQHHPCQGLWRILPMYAVPPAEATRLIFCRCSAHPRTARACPYASCGPRRAAQGSRHIRL